MKLAYITLSLISLSLLSNCTHSVPRPDITWYGAYLDNPLKPGLYSVDEYGTRTFIPTGDERAHGAQCLKIDDFYKLQDYLESLKEVELVNK